MRDTKKYQAKGLDLSVKDVDTKTRRVQVILSAFDNVDSDGDIIRKGAFAKSIMERGPESTSNRKIAFLRHHDWEHQIGKWVKMEETHDGLLAVGELGRSTKGEDALLDYQDGIIKEHSIGFNYVTDKMSLVQEGIWEHKEIALWEGSSVTFGSNPLTPTLDVSKGNKTELLEKVNSKMSSLLSAIKNGKGTDERLYEIEMALKVCQQQYNSLINDEPIAKVTPEIIEPSNDQLKQFYLTLLKK
jgi:HK97 family phage prohead protease